MTRRSPRRPAAVLALVVSAVMVLASVPVHADVQVGERPGRDDRSDVPSFQRVSRDADTQVKEIQVSWSGARDRDYVEAARVPGIGAIKLVCKPKATMIKLRADSRVPETQMWLAKYEVKSDARVVAVKNARIYQYANANDDGDGGTGRNAHEGLNQYTPVENRSQDGYAYGLVSQRPGRHQPAGTADLTPVTSFYLTWFWNGFDHSRKWQSCDMRLRLVTHYGEQVGLNWHGNRDAAGNTVRSATVRDFGEVRMTCEPGKENEQSIVLDPVGDAGNVYAETITGEGRVEDHVETESYDYDFQTGLLGPIELPRNGMLRVQYTVSDGQGGWTWRWFYVSAYSVLNNAKKPELNVCEIAVGGAADQS